MKILAIIATYNGYEWIDYCLGSLLASEEPVDIICIDNNSNDNTATLITEKYPNVQLIKNKTNIGFGKANNIGLRKCIKENYDYAFLLNQDARIEMDTISKLISAHKRNKEYGILSPIHRSITNDTLDYNFSMYLKADNTQNIVTDHILGNKIKEVYETNFVNAALWLISNECLQKIKIFDPDFPHYGEDDDFIFRAINNDFKVGIVPAAKGNHARYKVENANIKEDFNSRINRNYVNLLIKYKKNQHPPLRKNILFTRLFLIDIISNLIMLDFYSFKQNLIIYTKLLRKMFFLKPPFNLT